MAHFRIPADIFTGSGALGDAAAVMKTMGNKALIVTGKHVAVSAAMDELKAMLDANKIAWSVFDGITGEPTDVMITEGTAAYSEGKCDFIIGIGGGSPMDSAKAIALKAGFPPVVAIPTTAGTGSEATRFTVVTDTSSDVKQLIADERIIPKLAIAEPEFTLSSPKSITASTGLDALTHAVEAYTSVKAMPMTDVYAAEAVRKIMEFLPAAYNDGNDIKARTQMSEAALMAGICINNSSVTLVHGMSRPIGALFHVPHGLSNAMLLPYALRFALPGAYERFAYLGRIEHPELAQNDDRTAAEKFIDDIETLCGTCEVPTLSEYGIPEDRFMASLGKMAHDAIASGSPANTRIAVTEEDCIRIYRQAYR